MLKQAAGLTVAALLATAPVKIASATPTFSVIATLSYGPVIGAMKGTTLYGTTPYGGAGNGTLFSVTTKGAYTLLRNFDGGNDGSQPNTGIDLDSSGNVYGTAAFGGAHGGGTLWEYIVGSGMSTLHAFGAGSDGATPLQGPTHLASGIIFGSAAGGAINTDGNIWRWLPGGAYSSRHNFLSGPDGHCPFSGVAHSSTGTVYGTVIGGGWGGLPNGAVWQITSKNVFSTIYVFKNGNDGGYPDQAPVLDKAGTTLYGTTHKQNGVEFPGAIWKITAGNFSVLYDLNGATDGFGPNSPLMLNVDGNLYGTTANGGPGGAGTVFQITPAGVFKVMHAFTGGADGGNPTGMLAHDGKGAIYGGTASGQVFKIVP